MGASVAPVEVRFTATGIDAVRQGLRSVRDEAKGVGEAAEGISHSAVIGIGELTRGLGRIADTGQAGAFAMRELSGGVMRFASALGPAGGLVGVLGLAGGAIYEVFAKAREEMQKTQTEFNQRLDEMGKSASVAGLGGRYGLLPTLKSGDPFAKIIGKNPGESDAQFIARSEGIDGLLKLQRKLEAQTVTNYDAKTGLVKSILPENPGELKETIKLIEQLSTQYERAGRVLNQVLPQFVAEHPPKIPKDREEKLDDFVINSIIHSMPRFHDGADSADMRAMAAAQDQEELNKLLKKYNPGVDHSETRKQLDDIRYGMKAKGAIIPPTVTQQIIASFNENVQQPLGHIIRTGLGSTIGSALADGITAGFESHSIGGAFKAAGKAILAGLGGIFEQMGAVWIQYGIAMTTLGQALWNPLTSGPAAIAIGALLVGLGASLGAAAHGGSSGGSAGSSASLPAIVNTGFLNSGNTPATRGAGVSQSKPNTSNIFVIGTDPKAWRQVQEQLDAQTRRG